jgi:hypothetical protein
MASVRMTNDLRSNIVNRAMEAFAAARPQPKPNTWLTDRVRDAILESTPYKTLKDAFDRQGAVSFKSLGGMPSPISRETNATNVHISSKTGFSPLPHTASPDTTLHFEFVPGLTLYRASTWGWAEFCFDELPPQYQVDLREPCFNLAQDIRNWQTDRRTYEKKIQDLVVQCTTVKQMLLAWPAGESFVPDENKRRMYEKVTRIERAERIKQEVQFDDSFVNEVVLTAKLVGG